MVIEVRDRPPQTKVDQPNRQVPAAEPTKPISKVNPERGSGQGGKAKKPSGRRPDSSDGSDGLLDEYA